MLESSDVGVQADFVLLSSQTSSFHAAAGGYLAGGEQWRPFGGDLRSMQTCIALWISVEAVQGPYNHHRQAAELAISK